MTIVYSQNFDSTTVGTLPTGWTAPDSSVWAVTNAHYLSSPNGMVGPLSSGDGKVILYEGYGTLAAMEVRYDVAVVAGFVGVFLQMDATFQNGYVIIQDVAGTPNGTWKSMLKIQAVTRISVTLMDRVYPAISA